MSQSLYINMNGANPADGIIRNFPMGKIKFSSDGNMDIEKRAETHGDSQ